MHKNILVSLRTYNDIDHIVPIIWSLLEKGHHLHVFGLSNYDFKKDYRIKFIQNFKNCKIYLPYKDKKIFKFLKNNILSIIIFIILNKIDIYVTEWNRPNFKSFKGQFFYACKILNIPKIAVPHGYNVFLNNNINDYVKNLRIINPKILEGRNKFDSYVLATDTQRNQAIELGIEKKIAISLGSARYSYKWHKVLREIEKKNLYKSSSSKINVCFMCPHWSYNVNKEETFKMIEKISHLEDINLYVKPHTRAGSGILSNSEINNFNKNIKYVEDETSYEIISKSDVIISFGTSIVFEAILQNKYVLNPKFLHTNKTIFDNEISIYQPQNINEVIEDIKEIKTNKPKINEVEYQNIIKRFVYNNSKKDPMENYVELIEKY